MKKINIQ